jgi:purine-cytosine permease-like protein
MLPFSVMVLISFTLAVYFLDLNRFYIYGFMLGFAPILGEWLFQEFGIAHHG